MAWAAETFVPEAAALEDFHSTLSMRGGVDWAGTVGARCKRCSKSWESEATLPERWGAERIQKSQGAENISTRKTEIHVL